MVITMLYLILHKLKTILYIFLNLLKSKKLFQIRQKNSFLSSSSLLNVCYMKQWILYFVNQKGNFKMYDNSFKWAIN